MTVEQWAEFITNSLNHNGEVDRVRSVEFDCSPWGDIWFTVNFYEDLNARAAILAMVDLVNITRDGEFPVIVRSQDYSVQVRWEL